MKPTTVLSAVLVVSAGCAPMMTDVDQMRNVTDDIRIENDTHLVGARSAVTMAAMRIETERHAGVTAGVMSNIDASMVTMGTHCTGTGVTDLRLMHDELDDEMGAHIETMDALRDLGASRVEVERHASVVTVVMDGMDGAMGRMTCPR